MLNPGYLKVRQSQNDFLSWSLVQKTKKQKMNEFDFTTVDDTLGQLVFVRFFRGNWKHQKDILKLPDL